MDETYLFTSTKVFRVLASGFLLLAFLVLFVPQTVQASTASNTVIRNTVTVNYDDTAGSAMPEVTDSIDITVSLVAAAPTLSAPIDQSTDPATNAVYNYTITSNANGPDTYTLSTNIDSESAGISESTAVTDPTPSIILGATTAAAAVASGNATITVPNDAASDASINGIEDGATVVIGGNAYTVDSVTDNGGTVGGTSTIVLTTNLTTDVSAGDLIYERKTFTMTVDPGTVSAAANQTITVTTTADGSGADATDQTVTTVNVASITVTKEVSSDGTNWTGLNTMTFAPAATIYYRITVTNGGSSNATAVVLTDAQPAYTTYVAGSARRATGAAVDYGDAGTVLTDADAGDDGYDFNVTTGSTATYTIGTLTPGAGSAVQLFFRVTVN
ncbi:MAG: hypothetical protein ABFD81_07800 [Syntrophaceae bacterium]